MYRIILLITVIFLYGCSAQYHLNKAIKKGYKCEETGDTIRITTIDSIPVIINDTIVLEKIINTKDTIIKYNTVYVPKTRLDKKIASAVILQKLNELKVDKNISMYRYKKIASGLLESAAEIDNKFQVSAFKILGSPDFGLDIEAYKNWWKNIKNSLHIEK